MAGIHIDMEAFERLMVNDIGEMFGMWGLNLYAEAVNYFQPRQSFWQKLKTEIRNRPRVF